MRTRLYNTEQYRFVLFVLIYAQDHRHALQLVLWSLQCATTSLKPDAYLTAIRQYLHLFVSYDKLGDLLSILLQEKVRVTARYKRHRIERLVLMRVGSRSNRRQLPTTQTPRSSLPCC